MDYTIKCAGKKYYNDDTTVLYKNSLVERNISNFHEME